MRRAAAAVLLLTWALDAWASEPAAPRPRLLIPPQVTDARLGADEAAHLVVYGTESRDAPLLVWLSGTGGRPETGPRLFYEAALQRGYRLLALSYLNKPAVSQVCAGPRLRAQPDCAQRMRQQRSWGEAGSDAPIADRPEDAIVSRLTTLLQHLERSDPAGQWSQYLDGTAPRWSRILLAGQSQGGGMAAFIAQTRSVAGVIMFSGGWDRGGPGGEIAGWYARPSATPMVRWQASFHVDEAQAALMARIYQRLGIPPAQIHALAEPVRGGNPHGEGIANPAYQALWQRMLETARSAP